MQSLWQYFSQLVSRLLTAFMLPEWQNSTRWIHYCLFYDNLTHPSLLSLADTWSPLFSSLPVSIPLSSFTSYLCPPPPPISLPPLYPCLSG